MARTVSKGDFVSYFGCTSERHRAEVTRVWPHENGQRPRLDLDVEFVSTRGRRFTGTLSGCPPFAENYGGWVFADEPQPAGLYPITAAIRVATRIRNDGE